MFNVLGVAIEGISTLVRRWKQVASPPDFGGVSYLTRT